MKLAFLAAALALACGGTQTKTQGGGGGGGGEEGAADASMKSAWGGGGADGGASGPENGGTETQPAAEPPKVIFILENKGKGDLVFSVDKGWQPVLFAFRGKPPKAKSILMFPTACTESCEAPADTMCPDCKEEEDLKKKHQQERDETKREVAPAGENVEVPWDGQVYVYEKAPKGVGPKKKCDCWKKVDPEPGEYTIRACGFHPSSEPGKPSKPVCADSKMTLPAAAGTKVMVPIP